MSIISWSNPEVTYTEFETEEEWLEKRKNYVSSTSTAALFNVCPYLTEFEMYHAVVNNVSLPFKTNDRIEFGNFLEDGIANFAAHKMGCDVAKFKAYASNDKLRMGSSFDYDITSGDHAGRPLECKNVDFIQYRDNWIDGEPPYHIIIQCQHQMEITGAPGLVLAVLVGGNELNLTYMERDKEFGQMIIDKIVRFWQRVENRDEPEPDFEKDAKIISELYKKTDDGKSIEACDNIKAAAISYDKAREDKKVAETSMIVAKSEIISIFKDAERTWWSGGKITAKPNKKGTRVLSVSISE